MNAEMDVGTNKKAFQINLDAKKYGTFAEIGAGQEVARRFFHVGGASGTVAKTMSAYDMTFSDAIYGPADRYVSRKRLQTMLDHEYNLLIERLDEKFGERANVFCFCRHGRGAQFQAAQRIAWLAGRAFSNETRGEPSQIIIHVRMLDEANVDQQEALGVIGVNLALRRVLSSPAGEIDLVAPGKSRARTGSQVDMIKFSGPAFAGVDNRLMSLQLVSQGLTERGHVHAPTAKPCSRPKFSTRKRFWSNAAVFAR